MTDYRVPGPLGTGSLLDDLDDGTLVRARSPLSGPVGTLEAGPCSAIAPTPPRNQRAVRTSLRDAVHVTTSALHPRIWEAFWQHAFERADRVLRSHAAQLLQWHDLTTTEQQTLANAWARVRQEFRSPSSQLGRAYSRILKSHARQSASRSVTAPSDEVETVVESAGESGTIQHRLAMAFRHAGPAFVVLDMNISTLSAPRTDREGCQPIDRQCNAARSPARSEAFAR